MVFDTEAMNEEELVLARRAGKWGHPEGLCPRDVPEGDPHTYRIDILVHRDDEDEPRMRVSTSVEGLSFSDVADEAGQALNKTWLRLLEMSAMVDDD